MQVSFKRMSLINFKDHQSVTVDFGDITQISGMNGAGKTSIGEAVTWLANGVDLNASSKFDPSPTNREVETVSVELLLSANEQDLLLKRELVKGKAKYYINEVPESATKFNDLIKEIFQTKELFLSIFNPAFFCSQKWEEQRKQLLQYVTEPTNAEVLNGLTKVDKDFLDPLVKKHNLDDLEKIHRDTFNKKDKESIAAQSRVQTLEEQLVEVKESAQGLDIHYIDEQIITKKIIINNFEERLNAFNQAVRKKDHLVSQEAMNRDLFTKELEEYNKLKDQQTNKTCNHCGNPLNDEQKEQLIAKHQGDLDSRKNRLLKLKEAGLKFRSEIDEFTLPEAPTSQSQLSAELNALHEQKRIYDSFQRLSEQLEKAKEDAEFIRKARNFSLGVVDTIKLFRGKRAELMAAKLKEVFTTLDIRLTTIQKNGEEKIDFGVERGGVAYRDLSKAEQIRAGLEISDVFMRQADLIIPVFVDNSESIDENGFLEPLGQLILARVANTPFTIQTKNYERASEVNE